MLRACGWVVQDYAGVDLSAGRGVALREVPLKGGRCDYLLIVDRVPVGVVEAKKAGTTLSGVAMQSGAYAQGLPEFLREKTSGETPLPLLYESTGEETYFRDERDPHPRSRRVFTFHRPETLTEWLSNTPTLRARLIKMPFEQPLATAGLRDCQIEAIRGLEQSFACDHPRALLQMATGSGKTYTACAFTYRLIKHAGARRVLFLVDRANLGRQAKGEFEQFVCPETARKFTELYNIQHLNSNKLDTVCRVTICTIQRLYSMLRGEELPEDADELSTWEINAADGRPRDVTYNPSLPIETFDFIVTDECHRSIYNLWRQVLEYFDASLIGLTATPGKQTIGFFNQNLVTEYGHERAVADGVNVGYDVYRIQTEVSEKGGKVEKGFYVDRRNKETRKRRWEQLDEDFVYESRELDRSVVVPSQIRTVLAAYRDALFTELFPGRTMVPKTLIFAKDDSHAEDIVHLCREVFGKGNDFCKKITYQAKHPETGRPAKCEDLIQEFRTSPQLRIAVTVDMIATGTDIKPLEVVLFLRDVRSRVYFEQMKGRGTRVLSPTDLQAVSGEDARAKTHFVIVDAVGVCESDKTDSRPLEKKRSVAFDKLLLGVALGKRDGDSVVSLAGRLARLDREISPERRQEVTQLSGGKTIAQLAGDLLDAVDPDKVEAASRRLFAEREQARQVEVANFFNPNAPIENLSGNLPHWRQDAVTYFVTFRLADSMPEEKLAQWRDEVRARVDAASRRGISEAELEEVRRDAAATLSAKVEYWLDQRAGSCVLEIPECRAIVEGALRFFDGQRYMLSEFVVASNHVHVIVTPNKGVALSDILQAWKSFTAKEILKVEAASRLLSSSGLDRTVWQKESFDHIVRNPASLAKFEKYIRDHAAYRVDEEKLRRDAASTLINQACLPFDKPALREVLAYAKQEAEQTIDTVTVDQISAQGFDKAAKEKAANLVKSFRAFIETHQAEITALQILYSRPYAQRLTEEMLKELEKKLRDQNTTWTEDSLWWAFATTAPAKVKGRSQADRFADLVPLVRFALEQQPVLEPFAQSVRERFEMWLRQKTRSSGSGVPPLGSEEKRQDAAATIFTHEQIKWLELIRDHIATSLSMEVDDFDYAPFRQEGGLGKAHQLFGNGLPKLLDELNEVLAA